MPPVLARLGNAVLPTLGWGKQSVWLAPGSQTRFAGWCPHPLFAARGPKGREKNRGFACHRNCDSVDKEVMKPFSSAIESPTIPPSFALMRRCVGRRGAGWHPCPQTTAFGPCRDCVAKGQDNSHPHWPSASNGKITRGFPPQRLGALPWVDSHVSGSEPEDERKSRIKTGVAGGASGQSHLPAVRAVTGSFRCIKSGVKNMGWGHLSGEPRNTEKK